MTYKEMLESLKNSIQARITSESSADEIDSNSKLIAEIDKLDASHDEELAKAQDENAKLKDVIVRMVSTQGSSEKPVDDAQGSKPMTIDEIFTKLEKENKEK